MSGDGWHVTRRQCLASAISVPMPAAAAGCLGGFGGPLQVADTERVEDHVGAIRYAVTVENTGDEARATTAVVELSHTRAEGSIENDRPLRIPAGGQRTFTVRFRPAFTGGAQPGPPSQGEFEVDVRFEDVAVLEDYPGTVPTSERSAVAGGRAWPATGYGPGASAHNPETTAPRSDPEPTWSAPSVETVLDATGPVVADGTVYADRAVRAHSVADGSEQWVHDGPERTGGLAVGEDVVVFGTATDFRGIDASDGTVRWSVAPAEGPWEGHATVAEGRAFATNGSLYAVDLAGGEVDWSEETSGRLLGPPPVADGTVVADGDPLRAMDVADGSVQWTAADLGRVYAAAIAHETVFALTGDRLVALDLAGGRVRWSTVGPFQREHLAVGDDAVYVQTSRTYRPTAVDAVTGGVRWSSDGTEGVLGPPCATDGTLVVSNESDALYGIDTETGDVLWSRDANLVRPASVAVADGVCYFNEASGPLLALVDGAD